MKAHCDLPPRVDSMIPVSYTHLIKVTPPAPVQKPVPKEIVKKADLFSDNTILPLSAITEIANLPSGIQDDIRKLIENSNLYYLKRKPDGVFMIVGSSGDEKYMRHDVKFVEINKEGCLLYTSFYLLNRVLF